MAGNASAERALIGIKAGAARAAMSRATMQREEMACPALDFQACHGGFPPIYSTNRSI